MNLKEQLATLVKGMRAIVDGAKAQGRELNDEEIAALEVKDAEAKDLKARIERAEKGAAILQAIGEVPEGESQNPDPVSAKSLGEHFVKSGMAAQLASAKGKFSVMSPEFKAATDPTLTSNTGGLIPQFGGVQATKYRKLTIADLLAQGTLSGASLTYWTQGSITGDAASVAEGAPKPSLNFAFGQVTETLAKLAGVTKVSSEMTEDADFLVSVIQSQLMQRLAIVEEDQILNGNGTAPNLRGLLNRSGIQTYATTASLTAKKALDGIFHAVQMVQNVSFIPADGIVVNPTDYETMRLGVDGQQQYYGGGPFTGAYGNDGFSLQPALWTLPTVVTPAIAQGTVLVGAFKTAGQLFRKGGVVLDSTNSNEDDFKKNLVAMRVEERIALAVYYPTAFVKVTLTA